MLKIPEKSILHQEAGEGKSVCQKYNFFLLFFFLKNPENQMFSLLVCIYLNSFISYYGFPLEIFFFSVQQTMRKNDRLSL